MTLNPCDLRLQQVLAIIFDLSLLLPKSSDNLDSIESLLCVSRRLTVRLHSLLETCLHGFRDEVRGEEVDGEEEDEDDGEFP